MAKNENFAKIPEEFAPFPLTPLVLDGASDGVAVALVHPTPQQTERLPLADELPDCPPAEALPELEADWTTPETGHPADIGVHQVAEELADMFPMVLVVF